MSPDCPTCGKASITAYLHTNHICPITGPCPHGPRTAWTEVHPCGCVLTGSTQDAYLREFFGVDSAARLAGEAG